jgi:SPP1 gp7 family putative phage head morphogenesis protein
MIHPGMITNAQRDPTRTGVLRGAYVRAMRMRFGKIKKLIKTTIVDNDALRLAETAPNSRTLPVIMQAVPAPRYAFPTDLAGKAHAFMDWLGSATDAEILEVLTRDGARITSVYPWQNTYVRSAYARGVTQASAQLRQAKIVIPTYSMAAVFNYPMHADALALLFSRNFTDLKGITDEMSTQIARVLTEGLSNGVGPREIAKLIAGRVDKIGIVRGELLARTEIIRAHAEATLNRYQEFGIEGVTGEVEIEVAGDACAQCKDLVGHEYSIEDARGIIPVHPRCRCSWKPVINV